MEKTLIIRLVLTTETAEAMDALVEMVVDESRDAADLLVDYWREPGDGADPKSLHDMFGDVSVTFEGHEVK
jgi:oligoribonuclease NrnB/cAMP/cGMP phosphodiesterase (DHH superfamily)